MNQNTKMADEEKTDASNNALSGRNCPATPVGECRNHVYSRGGTAFVIENPFRNTNLDGSSRPSYALSTVASRIRMSMSTDKLTTDDVPVCHRYRPPSPLCHSIKDQRSRSVDNGLRKCQAEIQKVSERLSTSRRKEGSSSRAKSNCSTPVSVQTPPQLSSPLKSSCKPSALSSSFTEDYYSKPPRNKDISLKLGNFATLPSKLKKAASKDEMTAVSPSSGVAKTQGKHGTNSANVEKHDSRKQGPGLTSPNGANKESSKQGNAASSPAVPNKEFSRQAVNAPGVSNKESNKPVTTPTNAPNRDLSKQAAAAASSNSTAKESNKQGTTPTSNVSNKDLEVKQKKHIGTSKSPVPAAAKETKSRPEKESKGARHKEKARVDSEALNSDATKSEVAKENSTEIGLETAVEKNTSDAAKEDPNKSKADHAKEDSNKSKADPAKEDSNKSKADPAKDDPSKTKADPAVDEYRARLAEKRRLAREKAEREVEEERQRQEELRLAEEARLRAEEEEQRRREEEELRLAEELRKEEEERFQRMVELEEKRRREEAEQMEAELQAKLEQQRRAKEEAEKQEQDRQARIKREEEEKMDRKRRLESIMKRVKTEDTPVTKQQEEEPETNGSATTDERGLQKAESLEKQEIVPPKPEGPPTLLSFLNTSVDGANVEADKVAESLVPKFKSPLLQQILAGKNKAKSQNSELQKENTTVQSSAVEKVEVREEPAKHISDDVPDGSGQISTTCA